MPEVSVVIPTKDRSRRVRHTVASVLAQRGVDLEVVVVDDGSADDTSAVLGGVEGVRVVRHDTPRGVAAARNAGIAAATGDWVAFLDDDDLWAPDKLRRQLDAAARAGADWVYASALTVDEHGRIFEEELAPPPGELLDLLHAANPVPAGASNVMVRRAVLAQTGGFDETLQHFADWDLWVRLAQRGTPAAIDDALVAYVHHGENMHADAAHSGRAELDLLDARIRSHTGRPLDRALMASWMAYGEYVAGRPWAAARIAAASAVRHRSRDDARQAVGMVLRGLGINHGAGHSGEPGPAWAIPPRG